MKPIHKFNSGMGATLCHKCRVIINVGFSEELYCKNCIKLKEMKQEKLYTEEQVIQAMILAATTDASYNGVLNHLTPIELPSDEEIDLQIEKTIEGEFMGYPSSFRKGAKWMRDQILNK